MPGQPVMMLRKAIGQTDRAVRHGLESFHVQPRLQEIGIVTQAGAAVVRIEGLPGLMSEELVRFDDGSTGMAVDLEPNAAGVILLSRSTTLAAGMRVHATGQLVDTPVGAELIGRVVSATGRVLDAKAPLGPLSSTPIERSAAAIFDRAPVTQPIQTGIKLIDALIPIGRGQRELILGDRQTGKTSIALDTILNQKDTGVICIYCAIGQRGTAVAQVVDTLIRHRALSYTIVMVASGEDPPGLQYITPYAATAAAEFFMNQGRDVLIVYDDLTRHARAYRELSLLLRRPPGREAYPGDIFYLHARLLERVTKLRTELGGGSITALPIAETQAQDIAAYIPTNLISITDGQIYTSPDMFHKGLLPAIDIGRSVSRVGGKTQLPAYRAVSGPLRLAYSQFEELESFARFATRLDDDTKARIERGRRVREVLRQNQNALLPPAIQIVLLHAVNNGLFDPLALDEVARAEALLVESIHSQQVELCAMIDSGQQLQTEDWQSLLTSCRTILAHSYPAQFDVAPQPPTKSGNA